MEKIKVTEYSQILTIPANDSYDLVSLSIPASGLFQIEKFSLRVIDNNLADYIYFVVKLNGVAIPEWSMIPGVNDTAGLDVSADASIRNGVITITAVNTNTSYDIRCQAGITGRYV